MKWLLSPFAIAIQRFVVGLFFIYSGAVKFMNPTHFADSISAFELISNPLIVPMALILPVVEIMVGAMLVVGLYPRPAALAALILTTVFALALSSALLRGLVIDCGCLGNGIPTKWSMWLSLGRDLVLLTSSTLIYHFFDFINDRRGAIGARKVT